MCVSKLQSWKTLLNWLISPIPYSSWLAQLRVVALPFTQCGQNFHETRMYFHKSTTSLNILRLGEALLPFGCRRLLSLYSIFSNNCTIAILVWLLGSGKYLVTDSNFIYDWIQPSNVCQTIISKLSYSHQEVINKSSSRCQAVVRKLSGSCHAVIRKSSVSHQAVIR